MGTTLVEKILNCCDCFLRLSGFPDLCGKVFLITFKFSYLDFSAMFCKSNVHKTVLFFLRLLKYRELITVKSETLSKKLYHEVLKVRKKSSFYYVSRELWLGCSKKFICIKRSIFYIFSHPREFKNV